MASQRYVNISMALPVGVWDVIGATAAENGVSPGELVVQALGERFGAVAQAQAASTAPATGATADRPVRRRKSG